MYCFAKFGVIMSESKGFFRKLMDKYNELCKDLGVDGGACRGCVPIVKFDPETEEKTKQEQTK
ncbi:hypothetical protein F542_5350 [Bibersteinia trehalosi USDA-ARS-USMARC-188]|uniref:DUF5363 domain-containing protein n=3 Tax=Bibersteinia trehalosi TaxID=47735 RepID=A0A4V7I893_BIBTR|nr:hypothetical protein WQG_16730 [Bibersteinia trehalosi USDA-ARS-USMARC-192]AHG81253.1 hypothetical protein F542_5350 [Bibersteinia trehalosi USDA-ARS-USMARC-188]AHG83516.1 hypothetical protein F543_6520 [Bibersteinia trehalosi USDA-ARS-USMARC-189]